MKDGAGDDLLSGLEADAEADEESEPEPEPESEDDADEERFELTASAASASTSQEPEPSTESGGIPYLLRRNRVKEGRETIGFGLQEETRALENETLREVKSQLDVEKLPLTDLREAAYLAGLEDTGRIQEILLEWGYEHRR